MQVKKQQLELDMEQQTGSKSGKKYIKADQKVQLYFLYAFWSYFGWWQPTPVFLPGESWQAMVHGVAQS